MENRVVVDSDFCNVLAPGINLLEEKNFIRDIFDSLQKKPLVHTFVFNQELLTNQVIKELVTEDYIEVIEYTAFLPAEIFKIQYTETFADFYNFMNGETITKTFTEITKHRAKKNMGEIHSLILAQYMNIPIFMSNDTGAKILAKSKVNTQSFSVIVKNVGEVFLDIKLQGISKINKKAVRSILKKNKNWTKIYKSPTYN